MAQSNQWNDFIHGHVNEIVWVCIFNKVTFSSSQTTESAM